MKPLLQLLLLVVQEQLVLVLTAGRVTSVTITNGGTGYTDGGAVTFSGGGGVGAVGTLLETGGVIDSVSLTADNNDVSIDVSTLDRSKPMMITATILTTNQIAADGSASGFLQAAGDIGFFDVQKNA